jgi:hypothetical protein
MFRRKLLVPSSVGLDITILIIIIIIIIMYTYILSAHNG